MDAFVGEIRLLPYLYVPQGWLACDGKIYQAVRYQVLYAIIGVTYGGNVTNSTFAVPNLGGRVAVGIGDDPTDAFDPAFGAHGGAEKVTLSYQQVPAHTHTLVGGTQAPSFRSNTPANNWIGQVAARPLPTGTPAQANAFYNNVSSNPQLIEMNPASLSPYAGQGQAHENRQPYLGMQFCINFDGIFPSRN